MIGDKREALERLKQQWNALARDRFVADEARDLFDNGRRLADFVLGDHVFRRLMDGEAMSLSLPNPIAPWAREFMAPTSTPAFEHVVVRMRPVVDAPFHPAFTPRLWPCFFDHNNEAILWMRSEPPGPVRTDVAMYLRGTGKSWIGDKGPPLEMQMQALQDRMALLVAEIAAEEVARVE